MLRLGVLERLEKKLDHAHKLLHQIIASHGHHGDGHGKPSGTIGVQLIIDTRNNHMPPIMLPEHKTYSDRKTGIILAPTYLDLNVDPPVAKADPEAVVNITSSDEAVAAIENTDAGIYITTPAESGAATITMSATSPNARYDDVVLPFSYTAPIAGQLNVTVGADVADNS